MDGIVDILSDEKLEDVEYNNLLRYDAQKKKFITEHSLNKKQESIKDVFASASAYPCLPRYLNFNPVMYIEEDEKTSAKFKLIKNEPDCKRIHDYFEATGLNSFLQPIPGF